MKKEIDSRVASKCFLNFELFQRIIEKLLLSIIFILIFSLAYTQTKDDKDELRLKHPKIERQNIPYFVEIIDKRKNHPEQLMYNPNANLEKYPVFQYHAKKDNVIPLELGRNVPDEIWDLPIRIVNDIQGRDSITLRELANDKVLVLDFWAKWCSPCLKSMDKWKELQPRYNKQVQVVGLMLDWDYKAELMIHKMEWKMPQLIGPEVYLLNYYFCGIPITGPSAWIRNKVFVGLTNTKTDVENILEKMISGEISAIPDEDMWKSPF